MNGMETMLKTLLKAMGFDPSQFIEGMQGFINNTVQSMQSFGAMLSRIEAKLDRVQDHLEYIKPSVPPATCEVDATLNPVVIEHDMTINVEERKAA